MVMEAPWRATGVGWETGLENEHAQTNTFYGTPSWRREHGSVNKEARLTEIECVHELVVSRDTNTSYVRCVLETLWGETHIRPEHRQ